MNLKELDGKVNQPGLFIKKADTFYITKTMNNLKDFLSAQAKKVSLLNSAIKSYLKSAFLKNSPG